MAEDDESVDDVLDLANFADRMFETFVNIQKLQYAHLLEKEKQND
jgi:hypothetical protein